MSEINFHNGQREGKAIGYDIKGKIVDSINYNSEEKSE